MPDNFITTRTPGSRTSTYGLADHIAETDPHPQYLLKEDYANDGVATDGKLQAHMTDPNAHSGVLATIQMLNDYVLTKEFSTILSSHLYHDYAADSSKAHAASMSAVNGAYAAAMTAVNDAYNAALTALAEHTQAYDQNAVVTGHRDSENQELYAHREHSHDIGKLEGTADFIKGLESMFSPIGHDHDNRYALITHYHPNYLTQSDLESVGIYPNTTIGIAGTNTETGEITDPFDFNEETQQGNVSIAPTVMTSALNKPDITTPSAASFLNITTEITSADKEDDDDNTIYGERYVSQSLTTDNGIYYRIGHRAAGSLAEGQDESALWTWSDWQPVGGGSKDIFEVFYSTSTATPRGAFPLWTGETIINCQTLYPTFWQRALEYQTSGKIRVVTSTVYEQELTTYGECGAFVIDTATGNIRLPKITRFISSLDAVGDIGITKNSMLPDHTHEHYYSGPSGNSPEGTGMMATDHRRTITTLSTSVSDTTVTIGNEVQPKHVRLALYIQVYNSITASAITDLNARVGVLEQNAIMFARHDFIASQWNDNSDGTFTYTFNTNHFTSSHIYMNETGGSVLVDESVEVHIEGPTETDASSRKVRLVSPQRFSGYIITLG